MVRKPYIDKKGLKRGAWSEEEDNLLKTYILRYKAWNWNHLPRFAGLARCGKSCRMRWENYLKPGVKRGGFSKEDEELILKMQKEHGNKWSLIAKRMPGRTDNEIKNYWHTILSMRIKQNENSIVFTENVVETSEEEEEMHGMDQTENVSNESIHDKEHDGNAIIPPEEVAPRNESNAVLPITNVDSMLMVETSQEDTVTSNTNKTPFSECGFTLTEDMILSLEESFFAAPESFTLDPIFMDNDKYSYSSSCGSDYYPSLMNFSSSSSSNSRLMETDESWTADDMFSASPADIATELSSTDASNSPFLQVETSTLLGRLDSLESFGFWKALWNILN